MVLRDLRLHALCPIRNVRSHTGCTQVDCSVKMQSDIKLSMDCTSTSFTKVPCCAQHIKCGDIGRHQADVTDISSKDAGTSSLSGALLG